MDKILDYENFIKNIFVFEKLYDSIRVVEPLRKISYIVRDNGLDEEIEHASKKYLH